MGIKLRYWYRLTKAFTSRFRGILFVGVIAGLLIFSVLRYFSPLFSQSAEVIGLTGRYHIEELPQNILSDIGEGLTLLEEDGSVSPGLAESWESSEDGRVWTFYLDVTRKWHDGTNIKSTDIQYLLEDAEIERPDDRTIVFKLPAPFSPFPVVAARTVFKKGLIGTGEWKVAKVSLNNDQYLDKLTLKNSMGQKKILSFFPSEDSTKLAFQLGKVNTLVNILEISPFENWQTVDIKENINKDRFVAVFFNTNTEPFSNNKQLRQALSYAIDKQNFKYERVLTPISPSSWGYNPQVKDYAYDTKRAKDLLGKGETKFTLTTSPVLLEVAERVAEYWRELGVVVDVQVVSVLPDDYQAFMAIYTIPTDPDQYSIWHSTQTATNISNLNNPRIDKLLEDGRLELDQKERKKIYLDFQRFLLEEAPAIFLYHPASYTISRK